MNEFDLEKNLSEVANKLLKALETKEKFEKEIADLERINQKLRDKNDELYQENKNIHYWNGFYVMQVEKLMEVNMDIERKNKELNNTIEQFQNENLKLMESNKALVEEVEKLKKQNKELLLQNIELDGKLKEMDKLRDISWNKI